MYGPNQFGIVDQGWISHIATNKVLGRPTRIYGDGKQVRDALHVRDVVRLLETQARALTGPDSGRYAGEVFNVGGGPERTVSLIELCDRWGIKPEYGGWRPADQKVFYCDVSKAQSMFGWHPEINLDEGLRDILDWTQQQLRPNAD
jgi:CDP-paratose 2-epimerase